MPADRINLEFVLGNKVMVGTVNASRENFESGVRDMAQAEAEYPGWLRQLLTDRVQRPRELPRAVRALAEPERRDQDLLRGSAAVTCREFAEFIAEFLDGELPSPSARRSSIISPVAGTARGISRATGRRSPSARRVRRRDGRCQPTSRKSWPTRSWRAARRGPSALKRSAGCRHPSRRETESPAHPPAHRAAASAERKVTWLELFFDLVFVAAVAQVAEPLREHYTPAELTRFAPLFLLIWWAWTGRRLFSTRFDTDDVGSAVLTMVEMFAVAVMAANARDSLASRSSAGFAAAYAGVRSFCSSHYVRATALRRRADCAAVYLGRSRHRGRALAAVGALHR